MRDVENDLKVAFKTAKASVYCEEYERFSLLGCGCCLDEITGDGCPCCDKENNTIIWCSDYIESRLITDTFKSFGNVAVELWDRKEQKHCVLVNTPISDSLFNNGGKK